VHLGPRMRTCRPWCSPVSTDKTSSPAGLPSRRLRRHARTGVEAASGGGALVMFCLRTNGPGSSGGLGDESPCGHLACCQGAVKTSRLALRTGLRATQAADSAARPQNPLHRRSEFADYRKASKGDEFADVAECRRLASTKKCLLTILAERQRGDRAGSRFPPQPEAITAPAVSTRCDDFHKVVAPRDRPTAYSQLAYYISGALGKDPAAN
jgi:hypothetical protein